MHLQRNNHSEQIDSVAVFSVYDAKRFKYNEIRHAHIIGVFQEHATQVSYI